MVATAVRSGPAELRSAGVCSGRDAAAVCMHGPLPGAWRAQHRAVSKLPAAGAGTCLAVLGEDVLAVAHCDF